MRKADEISVDGLAETLRMASAHAFDDPQATARRFYYDNLVFDHATVRHLMTLFGVSQIFVGSDYPFAAGSSSVVNVRER